MVMDAPIWKLLRLEFLKVVDVVVFREETSIVPPDSLRVGGRRGKNEPRVPWRERWIAFGAIGDCYCRAMSAASCSEGGAGVAERSLSTGLTRSVAG